MCVVAPQHFTLYDFPTIQCNKLVFFYFRLNFLYLLGILWDQLYFERSGFIFLSPKQILQYLQNYFISIQLKPSVAHCEGNTRCEMWKKKKNTIFLYKKAIFVYAYKKHKNTGSSSGFFLSIRMVIHFRVTMFQLRNICY